MIWLWIYASGVVRSEVDQALKDACVAVSELTVRAEDVLIYCPHLNQPEKPRPNPVIIRAEIFDRPEMTSSSRQRLAQLLGEAARKHWFTGVVLVRVESVGSQDGFWRGGP